MVRKWKLMKITIAVIVLIKYLIPQDHLLMLCDLNNRPKCVGELASR